MQFLFSRAQTIFGGAAQKGREATKNLGEFQTRAATSQLKQEPQTDSAADTVHRVLGYVDEAMLNISADVALKSPTSRQFAALRGTFGQRAALRAVLGRRCLKQRARGWGRISLFCCCAPPD